MNARDAKVSDLYRLEVACQEQIMRLDVAMDHTLHVGMPQAGANLLQIIDSRFGVGASFPAITLQIAARQIFQHEIMKCLSSQVLCGAVTQAADDVRMTDAI